MRKLLIIFAAAVGISLSGCGSNNNVSTSAMVPDAVINSFNARYPTARDVRWDEDQGMYEAKFSYRGENQEAFYSPDGRLVRVDN